MSRSIVTAAAATANHRFYLDEVQGRLVELSKAADKRVLTEGGRPDLVTLAGKLWALARDADEVVELMRITEGADKAALLNERESAE